MRFQVHSKRRDIGLGGELPKHFVCIAVPSSMEADPNCRAGKLVNGFVRLRKDYRGREHAGSGKIEGGMWSLFSENVVCVCEG